MHKLSCMQVIIGIKKQTTCLKEQGNGRISYGTPPAGNFWKCIKWYLQKMYNNNSKSISCVVHWKCKLVYTIKFKLWRGEKLYQEWSGENPTKLRLYVFFPFFFYFTVYFKSSVILFQKYILKEPVRIWK